MELKSFTMVVYVSFNLLCIFTSTIAAKEIVAHGSVNNDANLILDLIKRLGEPRYNYQPEDQEESKSDFTDLPVGKQKQLQTESTSNELQNLHTFCEPVIQQGNIIKTTESIKAGAVYIDSMKNVKSNDDCLEYCCQNSTCDVAVYQDKSDRYCYLFRCNGRCIFKSHVGYLVSTIKGRKSLEHPEEDLQSLNSEVASSNSEVASSNSEVASSNSEVASSNSEVASSNSEVASSNSEVASSNSEVASSNSEVASTNSEVASSNSGEKKPAEDVVQNVPEKLDTVRPVSEGTTMKTIPTVQTNPPELVITPHSVGLRGFCTQDRHCEDPNAVCGHGNCVCKNTFYVKEGICRRICLPSEFECFELGTLSRGPECIPQSQTCDSYLNCADGSDEFNCGNNAPANEQNNWPHLSGPALSKFKNNNKNSNHADQYIQPVLQESADNNHKEKSVSQSVNLQTSFQGNAVKEHEMSSDHESNFPSLQNYNVRPTIANNEGSMHLSQNVHPGSAKSKPSIPNSYPNKAVVGNLSANSDLNAAHATNTNINHLRKGMANHDLPVPGNLNPNPNQQSNGLSQTNSIKQGGKIGSDNSAELLAPSQSYQTGPHQISDLNDNRHNPQSHGIQDSRHQASYSDAGQSNQDSSQFMGSPLKNHQILQAQHTSNQGSGMRSGSNLHEENLQNGRNSISQNRQHVNSLSPSQKTSLSSSSSFKSSKLTNSHSQNSGTLSSKPRSKIQSSNKSHASSFDQSASKSQNDMNNPSYSNSQKWIDPNIYMPYNLGESPSQQEQPQGPAGNHYYDSSQYYPPYSSDSLDPLPESLLDNTGSSDEFSQSGGPDIGHGTSLGLPYSSHNPGYQGYPETSYGNQYPPSVRYDDSGDYRSPSYQDPDFYSSLGSQRAYRPSAGLYEEFPSGMRSSKSGNLHKVQDKPVQSILVGQKNSNASNIAQGEKSPVIEPESNPTKVLPAATSNKNRTDNISSPSPSTAKPFHESHGEKKHIFLSSEKVIIANTSDAEGPIIALSLGLAFTLILLILVGCRLRNVRHRLRKGRPLHQNEADYLINGMYL